MKNSNVLTLLSVMVLCAMAFTATVVFAQGFNLQEAQQQAQERRERIDRHCPADDLRAAVGAYILANQAVDDAQDAYDKAVAAGSTVDIVNATLSLAIAKAAAVIRFNEAVAASRAYSACLSSIGITDRQ